MTIKAKFSSVCPKCNRRILTGEQVNWSKGRKAEHVNCGDVAAKAEFVGTECVCGYAVRVGDTLCPTCGANLRVPSEEKPVASTLNPGELIARFASRCNLCREDIHPGQRIARPRGQRAFAHVDCVGADQSDMRSEPSDPTVASRAEQQDTYHDVGPQAWDDRDPEPGDDFEF